MTVIYGKVQSEHNQRPLEGMILFEPRQLGYINDNILYSRPHFRQFLEEDGAFRMDIEPGEYYVFVGSVRLEVEIPTSRKPLMLKELLKVRYRS